MLKCKQCGEIKAEAEYRLYYGQTTRKTKPGRYKLCLSCESINNRYKYLRRKDPLTAAETEEISEIEELYDLLRLEGLAPPQARAIPVTRTNVQELLANKRAKMEEITSILPGVGAAVPQGLLEWFVKDISGYEEWELQDIFDKLEEDYRPKTGVDTETFKDIYDETHKDILDQLEKRFQL